MTHREYKIWLSGFLKGCGEDKVEDLEDEDLRIVIAQFHKIEEMVENPSPFRYYTYTKSV